MDKTTDNRSNKEFKEETSGVVPEKHPVEIIDTFQNQEVKPRLTIREVNNKIMGMVYGCVLGEILGGGLSEDSKWGFFTDQIMLVMGTLVETGMMHVGTFLQHFQVYGKSGMLELTGDHNHIDQYTKEIVSSYELLSDPAKNSFDQYNKYGVPDSKVSTCDNTPLIRCTMLGLYEDWDSFSFASTMSTHSDHRCISAGVIITSVVRSLLIGSTAKLSEIVSDTAAMILSMKKMTRRQDIDEYLRYTSEKYYTDLSLLDLKSGNTKHVYKCMAQSMYALDKVIKERNDSSAPSDIFKNILTEICDQGGDKASNCALSGAMMGCEIGYENLPAEWLNKINKGDRKVLNNRIIDYLHHMEFVSPDETDFGNILKKV